MNFNQILYSNIMGEGIPILIFHGLFGNGKNWITFAKKISSKYQVHLLDIRNHGLSFFSKKMNYELISEDIKNYIQYHDLNRPILIGHSMGGRAVMNFSIQYPLIPSKIIILDIAPKAYKNQKNFVSVLKKVNFDLIKSRKDLNNFLKSFIFDTKIRSFFLKCTDIDKNGKFRFLFYLPGIENNYHSLIYEEIIRGKYNGPTLFLRGEKSNYILNQDFKLIKKKFTKSKILTIKRANHWIHIENPKDFYQEVCIFLNQKKIDD